MTVEYMYFQNICGSDIMILCGSDLIIMYSDLMIMHSDLIIMRSYILIMRLLPLMMYSDLNIMCSDLMILCILSLCGSELIMCSDLMIMWLRSYNYVQMPIFGNKLPQMSPYTYSEKANIKDTLYYFLNCSMESMVVCQRCRQTP